MFFRINRLLTRFGDGYPNQNLQEYSPQDSDPGSKKQKKRPLRIVFFLFAMSSFLHPNLNARADGVAPYATGAQGWSQGDLKTGKALKEDGFAPCGQDCLYNQAYALESYQAGFIEKVRDYVQDLKNKLDGGNDDSGKELRKFLKRYCSPDETTESTSDCATRYLQEKKLYLAKLSGTVNKNILNQQALKADNPKGFTIEGVYDSHAQPVRAQSAYYLNGKELGARAASYDSLKNVRDSGSDPAEYIGGFYTQKDLNALEPKRDDFIKFQDDPTGNGVVIPVLNPRTQEHEPLIDQSAYQTALSEWNQLIQASQKLPKAKPDQIRKDAQANQTDLAQGAPNTALDLYNAHNATQVSALNELLGGVTQETSFSPNRSQGQAKIKYPVIVPEQDAKEGYHSTDEYFQYRSGPNINPYMQPQDSTRGAADGAP